MARRFRPGDRVAILKPHEPGHKMGTIALVHSGPSYGVRVDGHAEIHRWYVGEELKSARRSNPGIDELLLLAIAAAGAASGRGGWQAFAWRP